MIRLGELKPGLHVVGLEPAAIATIGAVVPIGEGAVQVYDRTADGITKERLLGLADEANLSVATVERPWSFAGNGEAFQLAWKAKRIDLATSGGTVASEVERVCRDNELVITTWSPIHLRAKLNEWYWKGGQTTAGAMPFWEDELRYLYLPRLKTREALIHAIRTGAASLD